MRIIPVQPESEPVTIDEHSNTATAITEPTARTIRARRAGRAGVVLALAAVTVVTSLTSAQQAEAQASPVRSATANVVCDARTNTSSVRVQVVDWQNDTWLGKGRVGFWDVNRGRWAYISNTASLYTSAFSTNFSGQTPRLDDGKYLVVVEVQQFVNFTPPTFGPLLPAFTGYTNYANSYPFPAAYCYL